MSKRDKTCTDKELINHVFDSIIEAKSTIDKLIEKNPAVGKAVAKAVIGVTLQHFGVVIYEDFEKNLELPVDED